MVQRIINITGAVTMILGLTVGASVPNWYTMTGTVVKDNTILTEDGNLWEYETSIEAGATVKVYLNDTETPEKEDDFIWHVARR